MILTTRCHINNLRLLWINKAKYVIIIIIIKVKYFSFIESVFYVSCMCGTLVREDKDTYFFFFFAQFTTPVIQFSDLLLSCQLILREGEERQLGLVYTWSLYAFCRIGYPSDFLTFGHIKTDINPILN